MPDFNSLGEFGFIDHIATHPLPGRVLCGIGDDCAVMADAGQQLRLVTTDMMVEGVHFHTGTPPEGLGHKLLAVNLSDMAAMGGTPLDAVVSIAVPSDHDSGYLERVYHGMYACADRFGVAIVGGDTTRSANQLILNLSLTGYVDRQCVCYRSGGQSGDLLYVSGTLGDAAAGLRALNDQAALSQTDRQHLLRKFHRPEPRLALGQALAATGAISAMMDLSDGLASDLRHICKSSGVGATITAPHIPLSGPFRHFCEANNLDPIHLSLSGGEDYELLFAVKADRAKAVENLVSEGDFPRITCVGCLTENKGPIQLSLADGSSHPMTYRGFDHFKPSDQGI